ncbi:MAG: hypothetical protein OHK0017_13840 [Patescibacteria group bacterium]
MSFRLRPDSSITYPLINSKIQDSFFGISQDFKANYSIDDRHLSIIQNEVSNSKIKELLKKFNQVGFIYPFQSDVPIDKLLESASLFMLNFNASKSFEENYDCLVILLILINKYLNAGDNKYRDAISELIKYYIYNAELEGVSYGLESDNLNVVKNPTEIDNMQERGVEMEMDDFEVVDIDDFKQIMTITSEVVGLDYDAKIMPIILVSKLNSLQFFKKYKCKAKFKEGINTNSAIFLPSDYSTDSACHEFIHLLQKSGLWAVDSRGILNIGLVEGVVDLYRLKSLNKSFDDLKPNETEGYLEQMKVVKFIEESYPELFEYIKLMVFGAKDKSITLDSEEELFLEQKGSTMLFIKKSIQILGLDKTFDLINMTASAKNHQVSKRNPSTPANIVYQNLQPKLTFKQIIFRTGLTLIKFIRYYSDL